MRFAVLIIFCLACTLQINAQVNFHGIYGGEPIIFTTWQWNDSCKRTIIINNNQLPDTFGATGFLDSEKSGLKKGDSIAISITSTCSPSQTRLINTHPHYQQDRVAKPAIISADTSGKLVWMYSSTHDSSYFSVQVYRWNKWVSIQKIKADTGKGQSRYEALVPLHAGENIIRINYWYRGIKSPAATVYTTIHTPEKNICQYLKSPKDTIYFTRVTSYEIYDRTGTLLKSGTGSFIDIKDLPRQTTYFINFDNTTSEIWLR
jgi:hypothetical protein